MSETPYLFYIHGFSSSPDSVKARILGEQLAGLGLSAYYRVPALSYAPGEAMATLEAALAEVRPAPVALVGSSLGGYYANYLAEQHGCPAVLINPAVRAYELLADYLGRNENLQTGEAFWFRPEYIDELKALDVPRPSRPQDRLVLVQSGDETLDYRRALEQFGNCDLRVEEGGSHGFSGFERWLGEVLRFCIWNTH